MSMHSLQVTPIEGKLPRLSELSPKMSSVLRLFLDHQGLVHQKWYPMLPNGDADMEAAKALFRTHAFSHGHKEPIKIFTCMFRTDHQEGSDLHPALRDLGCVHYYGGWKRRFDAGAKLKAPIWTGGRVAFRSSSKVLGPSLIESDVVVDTSAIVNRSVVCRRTEIFAGAQVGDAFIGRDVRIGPGVKLLHKTLDDPPPDHEFVIELWVGRHGRAVAKVRRPKCGVAIGDGCRIGVDAVLEPGTVLFPNLYVPGRTHLQAAVYRTQGEINSVCK